MLDSGEISQLRKRRTTRWYRQRTHCKRAKVLDSYVQYICMSGNRSRIIIKVRHQCEGLQKRIQQQPKYSDTKHIVKLQISQWSSCCIPQRNKTPKAKSQQNSQEISGAKELQKIRIQEHRRVITANVFWLHAIASWKVYALLKSDRSHANSFVGVGDEVGIIVSNSKDEAWSQYEHLHDFGTWTHKDSRDLNCQWSRALLKWWGLVRCRYHHRLAYRELRTEIGELKGRNNNKTRLEVGVEREIIGNRMKSRTNLAKKKTWVFTSTVKVSPTVHPVDGLCNSRKCFTAIQAARHSARISHAVFNTQANSVHSSTSSWISVLHIGAPERTYSSDIHIISLMCSSFERMIEAYRLTYTQCSLMRRLLCV